MRCCRGWVVKINSREAGDEIRARHSDGTASVCCSKIYTCRRGTQNHAQRRQRNSRNLGPVRKRQLHRRRSAGTVACSRAGVNHNNNRRSTCVRARRRGAAAGRRAHFRSAPATRVNGPCATHAAQHVANSNSTVATSSNCAREMLQGQGGQSQLTQSRR